MGCSRLVKNTLRCLSQYLLSEGRNAEATTEAGKQLHRDLMVQRQFQNFPTNKLFAKATIVDPRVAFYSDKNGQTAKSG